MNTKLEYASQHGSEIGKEYKKIEKGGTVYMFLGQFICKNSFKKFKYLLSNLWNKNNRYY